MIYSPLDQFKLAPFFSPDFLLVSSLALFIVRSLVPLTEEESRTNSSLEIPKTIGSPLLENTKQLYENNKTDIFSLANSRDKPFIIYWVVTDSKEGPHIKNLKSKCRYHLVIEFYPYISYGELDLKPSENVLIAIHHLNAAIENDKLHTIPIIYWDKNDAKHRIESNFLSYLPKFYDPQKAFLKAVPFTYPFLYIKTCFTNGELFGMMQKFNGINYTDNYLEQKTLFHTTLMKSLLKLYNWDFTHLDDDLRTITVSFDTDTRPWKDN
jgi:hypothetical protein